MRNRTPKLLAFVLAAVMTMGMTVSAATIEENPAGQKTNVNSGDTMQNNNGIVMYNRGEVINNNSVVQYNRGKVQNNNRTVQNNYEIVQNNYGIVENNRKIVQNNYEIVQNNDGIVQNNYGGTIDKGNPPQNQFYELPTPKNFSYEGEGATQANGSWWIKEGGTVTINVADGFYFESASISGGLGTITVADDHKSCTLSNVTGSLANGGLTLDVQEGEYTPEQPEPEPEPEPTPTPDPTPTTPPADSSTAAEPASAPTVQQMETAERPDPQDVEAAERYNFWMGVKADVRAAADGKTLRVHVPTDYINMPASVMEVIRLQDEDIVVDLRWSGEQLIITPATAQRKTALKAFWTFEQLCELYAR